MEAWVVAELKKLLITVLFLSFTDPVTWAWGLLRRTVCEDCWEAEFCDWSALAMTLPSHRSASAPLRTAWLRAQAQESLDFNTFSLVHRLTEPNPTLNFRPCLSSENFFVLTGKLILFHNADTLLWSTFGGCEDSYKRQYFPCAHHMLDEANWISVQS